MSLISSTQNIQRTSAPLDTPPAQFAQERALKRQQRVDQLFRQFTSQDGLLVLTGIEKGGSLPPLFRTSSILPFQSGDLCTSGLDTLRLSGSAQFTDSSVQTIVKRIREIEGPRPIVFLDICQEGHVHIAPQQGKGAISVVSYGPLSRWLGPIGSDREIIESERRLAQTILQSNPLIFQAVDSVAQTGTAKDHHTLTAQLSIAPKAVLTEKELVESLPNCSYCRIPDRKFGPIEWTHVDAFVNMVRSMPEEACLHIHCRRGLSRTTLFMTMYDMMRNGHLISNSDILIQRQGPKGLGGVDLTKLPKPESWDFHIKQSWLQFLYHFHSYVLENRATQFQKSWSTWAKEHGLQEPTEQPTDLSCTPPTLEADLPLEEEKTPFQLAERADRPLLLNVFNQSKIPFPANFRSTKGLYHLAHPNFQREGLATMNASGSGQYSQTTFELFIKKLREFDPLVQLHVFDLQHYPHLFVNGHDTSLHESFQELQADRSPAQITAMERSIKEALLTLQQQGRGIELLTADTTYPEDSVRQRFSTSLYPRDVEIPEEYVTHAGAQYHLLPTKRFSEEAQADELDFLVQYTLTLNEHSWSHFHCKMGKSRTTLFLTLFDILHNADRLPMEMMVQRQHLIGGINLFDVTPVDGAWSSEKQSKINRIRLLQRFHEYAREVFIPAKRAGNAPESWSSWSRSHQDFQPDVTRFIIDLSAKKSGE